ncbi:MAG TPA: carbohydrate kinase family protein [Anaerolineaceae bacterium]|nr:carbohydrate kinase family protein [Anaerolineaceae bacterium]
MFDVIGLGTIAMDIFFHVDNLPIEDGFALIQKSNLLPGGSGTNVVTQISRLSGKCGYIAQIGDDDIGISIIESLVKENIDTDGIRIKNGATSLHCKIIVDPNGRKFILLEKGNAFDKWAFSEINQNYLFEAKIFYTDLLPPQPAVRSLKIAKKAGLTTVFNLQMGIQQMELMGIKKETIIDVLEYVDIFAPCSNGFLQLCNSSELDNCHKYISHYFDGLLLCTLGENGSKAFYKDNEPIFIPAMHIKPVDTTGAGDSYLGAFIYAFLIANRKLQQSMKFATACAAYTCERIGARSSPNLEQALIMEKKFDKELEIE